MTTTTTIERSKLSDPFFEVGRSLSLRDLAHFAEVCKNLDRTVSLSQFIQYQPPSERYKRLKEIIKEGAPANLFSTCYAMNDLSPDQQKELLNLAIENEKETIVSFLLANIPADAIGLLLIGQLYFLAIQTGRCRVAQAIQNSGIFQQAKQIMIQG